ncbi:hypothetical protein QF030_000614 [Streptomyces rishiriensis]|uniref:Uncharacterized protein n=1 Tax=Streptomyces rishiriensis TaxID=68264 RepID=A0ABU0NH53_STRRH|nr:hypothetical protein [Streptomyces rishiriensis]
MENMRVQAMRFGAEMVDDDVVEVDLTGDIKTVTVTDTADTRALGEGRRCRHRFRVPQAGPARGRQALRAGRVTVSGVRDHQGNVDAS